MSELPDNVDLQWIARHLLGLRDDVTAMREESRDLKQEIRRVREDLDVLTMRVMRIDANQTALRDDIRTLWLSHRDHRGRLEALESK